MEATTPKQTAVALITIASHDGNYGEPLGGLIETAIGQSVLETGDLVKGVEHIGQVMAHLAFVASILARQLAKVADIDVEEILAPFAADAGQEDQSG